MNAPQQGPMDLETLTRYLARAHNNECRDAAQWGRKVTLAYLQAWNWCQAVKAGQTTARPSWLARRAIARVTDLCPLEFT